MPRNDDFEALIGRISEVGYEDLMKIEAEARRLRAQAVRHYLVQAFRWLTSAGRRDGKAAVSATPRHA